MRFRYAALSSLVAFPSNSDCELLTGLPPYDVRGRSIPEAADLIRRTRPMSPRKCNERITPAMMALLGNCLKKDRSERFESAEDVVFALDGILGERRHLLRTSNRRGLVHTSGHGPASTAFTAGALKALPPVALLVQQIGSIARRHRSIHAKLPWAWISLVLVGWLFLWIVSEIAREALIPNPVGSNHRRTGTHLSQPIQLPSLQEPLPDTDPTRLQLPGKTDEAVITVPQQEEPGSFGDSSLRGDSLP